MTPNRRQHLYTQYVLSIVNNERWYREANPHFDNGDLRDVLPVTIPYMRDIERDRSDELSTEDRAYVYLELAAYYGHDRRDMRNAMIHGSKQHVAMSALLKAASQPTPTELEVTMNQSNNAVAFETKHYVYGMDVANMSSGQLIDAIKRIEAEIADLKGVKAKSEHLKKRIAELEGMLVKVVEVLDAK